MRFALLCHVLLCWADDTCPSEGCSPFWAEVRRTLQLKLRPKVVQESVFGGRPARTRRAMVLSEDVFYGRAIMKIPRQALLTLETGRNPELKQELTGKGLRLCEIKDQFIIISVQPYNVSNTYSLHYVEFF